LLNEFAIPPGSKLYFGKTAKLKRELEYNISLYLQDNGFEEIITPSFSYSHHQVVEDTNSLIRVFDEQNNQIVLRADSTLDVVRIITKRLGRTTSHKKWFYNQLVYSYPTNEYNQIGCEWIGHNKISDIINLAIEILSKENIEQVVQISNINIVKKVSKELNIDIELFKNGDLSKLFDLNISWLTKLLYVQDIKTLEEVIKIVPKSLVSELDKLIKTAKNIDKNLLIAPLYYGSMKYYDDIYFVIFSNNEIVAKGGRYTSEGISSLGFAFYTDNLLKNIER
jgi:histidyl-tRNA synthetase